MTVWAMSDDERDAKVAAEKQRRDEAWKPRAAETLRAIASGCEAMAEALDSDDGILGTLAGMNLAENFPELPAHIRHTFIEYLDDEAAAGARADALYQEARNG